VFEQFAELFFRILHLCFGGQLTIAAHTRRPGSGTSGAEK
jgi:hypothetical protein